MNRKVMGIVFSKTNGRCWYCGADIEPFGNWEVDHQHPRSRGGSDSIDNLVPACRKCNSEKSDRTISEYEDHLVLVLSNQIFNALGFAKRLQGPDMQKVCDHLLEAGRYLYDTTLVFWGDAPPDEIAEMVSEVEATQ